MTSASALASVKNRLDIPSSDTTFDTQINDYVTQAVNRLFPRTGQETAPQTVSVTVDQFGEALIDLSTLPTPVSDVRLVEYVGTGAVAPADSKYVHGTQLRLRDLPSWTAQAKIYGLVPFTITTVSPQLELAVIWFAMSEFYENLGGNKRKFNIYMQTNGVSAMGEMRQEAQFYENKADMFLDEQATMYGSQ